MWTLFDLVGSSMFVVLIAFIIVDMLTKKNMTAPTLSSRLLVLVGLFFLLWRT